MSKITETIQKILDQRRGEGAYAGKGRLQEVERRIAALKALAESVRGLAGYIRAEEGNEMSPFSRAINADAEAQNALASIDCTKALSQIDKALKDLEQLKSRFERSSIRIAFIGQERQGKSTFIQSMTGLPNEVVPAYDGTSCTGALSVIHNKPGMGDRFYADVEFYSTAEFLNNIRTKLEEFFPGRHFSINSLDDLEHLDLSGFNGSIERQIELTDYITTGLIQHRNKYGEYLDRGTVRYDNDKDVIMRFVAQYRVYPNRESIPVPMGSEDERDIELVTEEFAGQVQTEWRHRYYWYLPVKSVNIYCEFPNKDCEKIEFVDTIGLGTQINSEGVVREMYRVLQEDCDGAINIVKPLTGGGDLPHGYLPLVEEIRARLATRNPTLWMVAAVNEVKTVRYNNTKNTPAAVKKLDNAKDKLPFAFYHVIDGSNEAEVNDKLVEPLLELLVKNLEALDNDLIDKASVKAESAVNACQHIFDMATKVVPMSAITTWDFEIDGFRPMNHNFTVAVNKLDVLTYAKRKDKPCEELMTAYEGLLKKVNVGMPTRSQLLDRFLGGHLVNCNMAFDDATEDMRNGIFDLFEDVYLTTLLPLQEKVKLNVIECLWGPGLMKELPLPAGSDKGPSIPWLECVIATYVPKEKYPKLYEALRYILDYQLSIEGLVEYNVARALTIIERTDPEFIPFKGDNPVDFEEKANAVFTVLFSRIPAIQQRLKSWMTEFSKIPSHSFYSRVHKFHAKIGTDKVGIDNFRKFYQDNMGLIWRDAIAASAKTNSAFTEWTKKVEDLRKAVAMTNL